MALIYIIKGHILKKVNFTIAILFHQNPTCNSKNIKSSIGPHNTLCSKKETKFTPTELNLKRTKPLAFPFDAFALDKILRKMSHLCKIHIFLQNISQSHVCRVSCWLVGCEPESGGFL